jgi:hypothetical protein
MRERPRHPCGCLVGCLRRIPNCVDSRARRREKRPMTMQRSHTTASPKGSRPNSPADSDAMEAAEIEFVRIEPLKL